MSVSADASEAARFAFGRNWRRFIDELDASKISKAEASLRTLLGTGDLAGRWFIDIGSGSGLFSLAARRLGARVYSFDYDPESVGCTHALKQKFFPADPDWTVEVGSVLDEAYLSALGPFDIVYSWGVLHHTGAMWQAVANAIGRVAPGGTLVLALYNDQGRATRAWTRVKRLYNRLPPSLRWLVLGPAFVRLWGPTLARDLLTGNPLRGWRAYGAERGMSPWRDVVDWAGGWPFEVAKPEEVFDFCRDRGFTLTELKTCAGGLGCNEFVFRRAVGS